MNTTKTDLVSGPEFLNPGSVVPILILIVMGLVSVWLGFFSSPGPELKAVKGEMDLAGWGAGPRAPLPLGGEWQVFHDRLLTPEDFAPGAPLSEMTFQQVPTPWMAHRHLSALGFATYRLVVKNIPPDKGLGLRLNSLMEACIVWINGRKIHENGIPGKDRESQVQGRPRAALIPLDLPRAGPLELEILIQVSKYRYISGGAKLSLYLGQQEDLLKQKNQEQVFSIFSTTLLLVIGCYHLVFYFFRRQDPSLLYFSLYCLLWMVLLLITASYQRRIPVLSELPLPFLTTIDNCGYFFATPLLFLFLQALFPRQTPALMVKSFLFLALGLTMGFILAGSMETVVIVISHIISAASIICFYFILARASSAGHLTARIILSGGILLWLCGVNDILNALEIIQTGAWIHGGLLIFIFTQAVCLAYRFASAFRLAQDLGTELKEKNRELTRLDTLKDEFIANTSHELRTPLSGIIGIAESMTGDPRENLSARAARNLEMISVSGRRLSNLLEDVLDFSRLKHKDLHINLRPVDLAAPADMTLRLLSPLARAKGISLVNEIGPGAGLVMADEDRLQQIFQNLVGNAIKFTSKGQVRIWARPVPPFMEIAVQDTGIGIPKERIKDIFLYFEQVRSKKSGAAEGTGLGLSISKQLIELHRGRIRVDSVPDRGTTFFFTLPLAEKTAAPAPHTAPAKTDNASRTPAICLFPPPEPASVLSGSSPLVLVVDDDPINLQVAVNLLEAEGLTVKTTMNGKKALVLIREEKPDLILLDIMMPEMDGYEVCRELRLHHSMSALPVIMLTARSRTKDLVKGFDAGANDYLTKPFSREELLTRVNTQLKLTHAYTILEDNLHLKNEIRRRKKTEMDLLLMQRRMERILDALNDPVIAVNENLEVCFSNAPCQRLLGYETRELLGLPVSTLFLGCPEDSGTTIPKLISRTRNITFEATVLCKDGTLVSARLTLSTLDMDDETLRVIIFENNTRPGKDTVSVIEAVNQNRECIALMEKTLTRRVEKELTQIHQALAKMEKTWTPASQGKEKKQTAVQAMKLALACWQNETGLTKIELAEQSGVWKVYMNQNGFQRTQTLDKYLDLKKFPENPKWHPIFETIDFVLISCTGNSPLRQELEAVSHQLHRLVK